MNKDIHAAIMKMLLPIEPTAELILHGISSTGKGKHSQERDFLILVDGEIDSVRIDRIKHLFYSVEKETGHPCTVIIKNRLEWNNPKQKKLSFSARLKEGGIDI